MKTLDELPAWIKELSIKGNPLPDFDYKAEYDKHLDKNTACDKSFFR